MPAPDKGRACDDVRDYHPALAAWGVTEREAEVARLVATGYSNARASDELDVSIRTVKGHVHQLFLKLGVRNRGEFSGEVQRIVREFRAERDRKRKADAGLRLVKRRKPPRRAPPAPGGPGEEREPREA